jgi:hypothetical protein
MTMNFTYQNDWVFPHRTMNVFLWQPSLLTSIKKWGFSIKKLKWKLFIEGHRFTANNCTTTLEVELKKLDLDAFINGVSPKQRVQSHFIRIGILNAQSLRKIELQKYSDGRMIVTPPRLNGFRIKQQSFRQCVEQFKWNYVLEKEEDDDIDADDEDNKVVVDKDDDDDIYTDTTTMLAQPQ